MRFSPGEKGPYATLYCEALVLELIRESASISEPASVRTLVPFRYALNPRLLVFSFTRPGAGGASGTPARVALLRPIAIACSGENARCLRRRCSIFFVHEFIRCGGRRFSFPQISFACSTFFASICASFPQAAIGPAALFDGFP